MACPRSSACSCFSLPPPTPRCYFDGLPTLLLSGALLLLLLVAATALPVVHMADAEVVAPAPAPAPAYNTNAKRQRKRHKNPTADVGNDIRAPLHKIALCLYGTISRSIQRTWPHMETKLIGPLTLAGYEVDIYGFGMDLGSSDLLDGVAVNPSATSVVPYTAYESVHQADVDRIIDARCAGTRACSVFLPVNQTLCQYARHEREATLCLQARHEREVSSRNALRQLYSESRVGVFLQSRVGREYAAAVVVSPDYHIALAIDGLQLLTASLLRDTVYTTDVNPGGEGGTTNGFYFGAPLALSKILRRYDYLEYIEARLLRTEGKRRSLSYEQVLGHAFTWANVTQASSPLVFFKIRADGMPDWQGPHSIKHLAVFEQQRVLFQWDSLIIDLCAWERLDGVPARDLPRFQSMRTHFICACNGMARFGFPGYWSPWQTHRMASSKRQDYMHCDVHKFQKPLLVGPSGSRGSMHIHERDWWFAQKWYAKNRTRRQCQCKLNISEHVDANGPYALSAEVTSMIKADLQTANRPNHPTAARRIH